MIVESLAFGPTTVRARERKMPQSYGTLSHLCASLVIESARARCGWYGAKSGCRTAKAAKAASMWSQAWYLSHRPRMAGVSLLMALRKTGPSVDEPQGRRDEEAHPVLTSPKLVTTMLPLPFTTLSLSRSSSRLKSMLTSLPSFSASASPTCTTLLRPSPASAAALRTLACASTIRTSTSTPPMPSSGTLHPSCPCACLTRATVQSRPTQSPSRFDAVAPVVSVLCVKTIGERSRSESRYESVRASSATEMVCSCRRGKSQHFRGAEE